MTGVQTCALPIFQRIARQQRGLGRRTPWLLRGGQPDSDLHTIIVRQKTRPATLRPGESFLTATATNPGPLAEGLPTREPVLGAQFVRCPRQSLPITTQRSSALPRPTSQRARAAIQIRSCRPSFSRTPGRLHFRDRQYARRSRMPAAAWRLDPDSSRLPPDRKWTEPEVYDVWKHARIRNQLTAFTRTGFLVVPPWTTSMAMLRRSDNGTFCPRQRRARWRSHRLCLSLLQADLFIRAGHTGPVPKPRGPAPQQQSYDCTEPSFRRSPFHPCE